MADWRPMMCFLKFVKWHCTAHNLSHPQRRMWLHWSEFIGGHHPGRDKRLGTIAESYICKHFTNYIRQNCTTCHGPTHYCRKAAVKIHPFPGPLALWAQHITNNVVDQVNKFLQAKPMDPQGGADVALFPYKLPYRLGTTKFRIITKRWEFVNAASHQLLESCESRNQLVTHPTRMYVGQARSVEIIDTSEKWN